MKRGLLVFLALCAFAVAMIPRDRRAVNTEEEEELLRSMTTISTSTDKGVKRVCAPQTPCAWSVYKPGWVTKHIEMNITNTYCNCGPGTVCQVNEDDSTVSAYVHRCRPPMETEEDS